MSHSHTDHEAHNAEAVAEIKKVTIILTVFTIIELILGFWMISMTSAGLKLAVKGTIVILMMAKAFYIVAYFMHLKHEVKNLIMTIVVPLLLFLWFIGAFLWDGNSFRNLRNNYDSYFKEQATIKVEKKEEEHESAKQESKHESVESNKESNQESKKEGEKPEVAPYY
jgi:cytochrome c oxidase subunit 4